MVSPTLRACGVVLALAVCRSAFAQESKPVAEAAPIREIYVPFEDLNVILDNDKHRAFLTREEYDELVKLAKAKPQRPAPHKVALVAAEYEGQLEDGRALIDGKLQIDVLDDGLFALPLELGGVGLRSALLDGKPAPLSRNEQQQPIVLLQGQGSHKLELKLTAPLHTAAAQQTLQIALPSLAATKLKLSVPGNVDVKGGAAVVSKQYDMAANRTVLELLPQHGGMAVVMSLNNRLLQDQRVVVARSVIVDEVTQGYERIHATISYRVLHGAVEKLRLAVPAGFEVTKVEAVQLARWEEKAENGRQVLEASLREATSEQIVLHLTANRSPAAGADWLAGLADWKFPKLEPLDTAGNVAVLGLLVEDRLKPEQIASTGLLPIDLAAVLGAIPASVLKAEPGAPSVRQVVSYYAPASEYALSARFVRPPAGLKVAANSLLVIGDQGLTLQGGFALTPQAENLFQLAFTLPAGWQVTQVTAADGAVLPIERYPQMNGSTRVSVRLTKGIPAGQTQTVNYQALATPAGWLTEWQTQTVPFPKVLVEGATSDSGAVAAQTTDDLVVRPDQLTSLTPLLDNEKAAYGLRDITTALAYRFENRDFAASLIVERTVPSLTAQVYSILRLERDNLAAHYELNYDVREARTRRVAFSLPLTTPAELTIQGLGGTAVKEFTSVIDGPRRRWNVQLAERQIGEVKLLVQFTQRMDETAQQNQPLPLVQAEDVEHQSAVVAVEGDAELDVSVATAARGVDIGELAGSEYPLQNLKRVIGTFGYVGTQTQVAATIRRRDPYTLPPALIARAELVTQVSASGVAQSVARYDLVTKATLLEIKLPTDSKLWTVILDNQPTKPQREGESLLLSLPAQERVANRKLQLVYETPSRQLGLSGTIDAVAPTLLIRAAGEASQREIPQADLEWQLILPSGYTVRRAGGSVFTDELPRHELAALKVAGVLYELAGGIRPWYWTGRQASSGNHLRQIGLGTHNYHDVFGEAKSEAKTDESAPVPATADPGAMPGRDMPVPLARAAEAKPQETPPPMAMPAPATPPPPAKMDDRAAAQPPAQPAAPQAAQPQQDMQAAQQAGAGSGRLDKAFWALEGVSSLPIDIDVDAPATTFRSLGEQPQLAAEVIDQRRTTAAAWGLALLTLLVGVGLTLRPARTKATYVIVILLVATVPLLLTTAFDEMALVFDYVFYAGCLLIPYYLLAAVVLAVWSRMKSRVRAACCEAPVTQIAALLIAVTLAAAAGAQQPPPEDTTPVAVPADAIIVPYDPDKPREELAKQKLLVPYAKYVELWNLAHPDKKIETAPPPVGFAIAGTTYEATLGTDDFLSLVGRMQIDVFTDKPVSVPLHLGGGVLEKATVDGQAAKLQLVEPDPKQQPAQQQAKVANPAGLPPRMLLLHLAGKGRKTLELHVRLGLSRQGGWRIVRGQLPVGPAAALTLTAPTAGTEIRQTGLADRASFDTKAANEKIETALGANGALQLQWRPKVAEGMVDQALTARSIVAFDVREDSLRASWQLRLEFGRAFRDAFSLTAPADYLIESVTGDNVRGWAVKKDDGKKEGEGQRIDVTLLKPVQGGETLTLQLAKRGRVGQGDLAEFDVPLIQVEGAALEQGEIAVRRSPRLDLRTLASASLVRADAGGQTAAVEQLADAADAAVLLVKPYQTFRFVKPPYRLSLAATPMPQGATAEIKASLPVGERETLLDAAVTFRPEGQPLYQVRMYLPDGFKLDRLLPGDLEWAITTENNRQLLTVYLLDGRSEPFTIAVRGPIAATGPAAAPAAGTTRTLPLPKLEVLDVQKQEGEIVIIPDRDTDVRLDQIANAETAPLTGGPAWMKDDKQREGARAVVRYRAANYAATIALTPRTPIVSARSISNVKITPRSIEETVLIDFRIEQAGIRRVSFLVPQHLAKARLLAKQLKQKIVETATGAAGSPPAGMVRFRLELQEDLTDQYSVLLMHDRLLTGGKQKIELPVIETGRTDRRFVALENAGRDEIVVGPGDAVGLEPVNRQQQAWRELAAVLGGNVTQAYAALDTATQPSLSFGTVERQQADRASARIDLGETLLVVDDSGAYRGLVQYRVKNANEQFLEFALPAGARLWTAQVAGEPVKPVQSVPPQEGMIRVPLIKSAEGAGDYPVVLKYGGKMIAAPGLGAVKFPLIRTTKIHVEKSHVRLLLPESQQWFNFDGTMRQVTDEEELQKEFQGYLNRRIMDAAQDLNSGNDFTKVRAADNLKQSRQMFEYNKQYQSANNLKQLGIDVTNEALLSQAEQQAQTELAQQQQAAAADNRSRLNYAWGNQGVTRSKSVVSELGSNFDSSVAKEDAGKMKGADALNPAFLDQNKLRTETESESKDREATVKGAAKPNAAVAANEPAQKNDMKSGGRFFRGNANQPDESGGKQGQGQGGQRAPEIAGKKEVDELQQKFQKEAEGREQSAKSGDRAQQLQKYQQNLDLNNAQQLQQPGEQQYGVPQPQSSYSVQPNRPGGQGGPGGMPQGGYRGYLNGQPGPSGGMGAGGGAFGPIAQAPNAPPTTTPTTGAMPMPPAPVVDAEELSQLAAGLASLDVPLPERGRLYRFTTPRGDLQITARAIPVVALQRLGGLAAVLAAIFVVWLLGREKTRRIWASIFRSAAFAVVLIVAGVFSVIVGVFPLAGLVALVAGIVLVVLHRLPVRATAA